MSEKVENSYQLQAGLAARNYPDAQARTGAGVSGEFHPWDVSLQYDAEALVVSDDSEVPSFVLKDASLKIGKTYSLKLGVFSEDYNNGVDPFVRKLAIAPSYRSEHFNVSAIAGRELPTIWNENVPGQELGAWMLGARANVHFSLGPVAVKPDLAFEHILPNEGAPISAVLAQLGLAVGPVVLTANTLQILDAATYRNQAEIAVQTGRFRGSVRYDETQQVIPDDRISFGEKSLTPELCYYSALQTCATVEGNDRGFLEPGVSTNYQHPQYYADVRGAVRFDENNPEPGYSVSGNAGKKFPGGSKVGAYAAYAETEPDLTRWPTKAFAAGAQTVFPLGDYFRLAGLAGVFQPSDADAVLQASALLKYVAVSQAPKAVAGGSSPLPPPTERGIRPELRKRAPGFLENADDMVNPETPCLTCHSSEEKKLIRVSKGSLATCENGDCHSTGDLKGVLDNLAGKFSHPFQSAINAVMDRGVACDQCHNDHVTGPRDDLFRKPHRDFQEGHDLIETWCEACHNEMVYYDGRSLNGVCFECHDDAPSLSFGTLNTRSPHQADWVATHFFEAQNSTQNCQSCHGGTNSCDSCHDKKMPNAPHHGVSGFVPSHADHFQSSGAACVSCHTETSQRVFGLRGMTVITGSMQAEDETCKPCHK